MSPDFYLLDRLPRFTFLHGPPPATSAFSIELAKRLGETHLINLELETPILDAASALFYDNDVLIHDLADPIERMKHLPYSSKITINDWISRQKDQLRETFGPDILGRIFLHNYLANNYEDLAPKVIVSDLDSPDDIKPMIDRYGHGICCINLGPLSERFVLPSRCRTYWIAVTEPYNQVSQFLRDLQNERTTS